MKKAIKFGILLGVFVMLVSGNFLQEKTEESSVVVHRYHYYNQNSIVESDTMFLFRKVKNDSIEYLYQSNRNIEEYFYLLKFPIEGKSYLRIYNLLCPLVDQYELQIFNRSYSILKYDYDIKRSSDEETSYFFCEDYGLLVVDNYAYAGLIFSFEYDSVSKRMVEEILQDKELFGITDYSVLPPPPTLD